MVSPLVSSLSQPPGVAKPESIGCTLAAWGHVADEFIARANAKHPTGRPCGLVVVWSVPPQDRPRYRRAWRGCFRAECRQSPRWADPVSAGLARPPAPQIWVRRALTASSLRVHGSSKRAHRSRLGRGQRSALSSRLFYCKIRLLILRQELVVSFAVFSSSDCPTGRVSLRRFLGWNSSTSISPERRNLRKDFP